MKALVALILAVAVAHTAAAQPRNDKPTAEYPTVAAALSDLRLKSGVKATVESGWTIIEDPSTLSLWSFVPQGHPAYPSAVHRKVVQKGNELFVSMDILCEAPKPACDVVAADFDKLNNSVRDDLKR